ncbi:MAG: cytochrome c [Acidobacteriota bacterium]
MNKFINATGLAILSVVVAGAWFFSQATQLRAQSAQQTFDAKCEMCHAKDGSGNTPMGKNMKVPDLRSKAVQSKTNAELGAVIEKGKGVMPAYGSQLSKKQVTQMVEYVRQLAKKK